MLLHHSFKAAAAASLLIYRSWRQRCKVIGEEYKEEASLTLPPKSIEIPKDQLTHKFLLRQTCALSADSAASMLTQAVLTIQETTNKYLELVTAMADLYDNSVIALSEEGNEELALANQEASKLKQAIFDLELLFHFVKKLMDANAEVCFLVGAEFASVQTSERIRLADTEAVTLFGRVKQADLDLAEAKKRHIELVGRTAPVDDGSKIEITNDNDVEATPDGD